MSIAERRAWTGRYGARIAGLLDRVRGREIAYPLGYMAGLDGARGLLTLGVLLAHTRYSLFGGAMVYMDVFFTMSGYLITSLLIKDYERHGRISLRKFYVRRFMRLYPALTMMIVTLVVLSLLFSTDLKARLTEAAVAWFYLMDYSWLLLRGFAPRYTSHTWSLAVEEQFYLLWPLAFIALLRFVGLNGRTACITLGLALLFWLWKIGLTWNGRSVTHLYNAFDTRADALLFGCALAVALKVVDLETLPRLWKFCARALPYLALIMIACAYLMDLRYRWYYYASPLFGALPAIILIIGLQHPDRTIMHRIYEHPIPVFIGRICYGLYIWHFPIFVWVGSWPTDHRTNMLLLVGWPLSFLVATLSFYLVERPFMRARPGV